MIGKALFTSDKDNWATPQAFVDTVADQLLLGGFELDPCCEEWSAKASTYFTGDPVDGLAAPWFGRVWVNPPYGRSASRAWMGKVVAESNRCEAIVALMPARTDTIWFQDIVLPTVDLVAFVRGRIAFERAAGIPQKGTPFPSVVLIWYGTGSYGRKVLAAIDSSGKLIG